MSEDVGAMIAANMGELNDKLGVVMLEVTPERIVATMPVEGNRQPYGLLHGGASVALAESLGSTVAALNCPPDRAAVGIEINATHHRSAMSGLVTATSTPINIGRTLVTSETVVRDEAGKRICTVRLTCLLREQR